MATIRFNTLQSSPSTQFYMYADQGSQSVEDNSSLVAVYLRAINRGNSSSSYGGAGTHRAYVNGTLVRNHTGDPFLPSGYADNQDRWYEGPYYITVPHNADGTKTVVLRMYLDYGAVHYDASVNLTLSTLRGIPNAPTGAAAVRESDSEVTVSWAQSSPSNSQPTSNTVRRKINGGGWADVVTVAPTTSVAFGAAVNQKLVYGVKATNSAGVSDWSADSAPIFTTPAAPTGVAAAKDAALDIAVSWTPHVAFTEHQHIVEHGTVTGGVTTWDGSPLATVAAGTSTFKHVGPDPSDVHVYRVSAKNTDTGALQSAKVVSNQVQLLVAPDKPSLPTIGQYADKGKAFTFGWTHNPIDTTSQTAYEVEYSLTGGSSWSTTGKTASTTMSETFAGGTYAANDALTMRVRTWGEAATGGSDGTGASPWSDPQTVTFKSRPVGTIVSPADSSTWVEAALTVGLGFEQAEGGSFVRATIVLNDGAEDVETKVSTTPAATTLESQVENGATYTVTVTVLDSHGLTSDPVTSTFDVAYTLPVTAGVTITYLEESGIAQLDLTIPAAGVGEAEAVAVTIFRTIDGVREIIVADYPAAEALTILDMTPTVHGVNEYRVRTVSADGATASAVESLVTTEKRWAFLSTGPGFSQIIAFFGNLEFTSNPSRSQALVGTAGRRRPIALFGEAGALQVSGSASLVPDVGSTRQQIEEFILTAGTVCYRDPSGRRMFGTVSGNVSSPFSMSHQFQYAVTEAS
ncbi:MAG: hypothetical protein WED09_07200 [Homoserinimonas sp.]